jgi:hypothetical protein
MSIRTDLLAALRTDLNVTGMITSFISVPDLIKISDSELPSYCVKFGTAVGSYNPEGLKTWEVPVLVVGFFKCGNDTTNQGLLETEAERIIGLYDAITDYATTRVIEAFQSIEMLTVTPYIDTGMTNRGFVLIEYKLIYIGD